MIISPSITPIFWANVPSLTDVSTTPFTPFGIPYFFFTPSSMSVALAPSKISNPVPALAAATTPIDCLSSFTVTVIFFLSLKTPSFSYLPGSILPTTFWRADEPSISLPLAEYMRSPLFIPPFSAGDPFTTSITTVPPSLP